MVCLRNFLAQYGGLGTGKMARLRNFCGSLSGGLGTGKMVCLRNFVAQ